MVDVTSTREPAEVGLSTRPEEPRLPTLGPLGWVRWAWRALTSMRTALMLLFLLALASVPGSVLPQRGLNPIKVSEFFRSHRTLAPLLDRLSLFDVFAAPWFAAIYLLLFTSLAGCVLPRTRRHWMAMRARPPAAPRHLARLPVSRRFELTDDPDIDAGTDAAAVLADGAALLRRRHFRVDVAPGTGTVSAEKGYLRETGNLVFHLALLLLLAAVGLGSLWGFKGSALVVEGDGFANTVTQYDDYTPGRFFGDRLAPFSFRLDDFSATYQTTGSQRGAARSFDARVTYRPSPGAPERPYDIRVNAPLVVGGTKVFLIGHGYAPVVTVRDGTGRVVLHGAVPFLPQDGNFTSTGVVKVPDARPTQIGFNGFLLPTTVIDPAPRSAFPAALNPAVFLLAWKGDLGLDSGVPQSVYRLDTSKMKRIVVDGKPLTKALGIGDTMRLPDGEGSIRVDGLREWATFSVASDPGKGLALAAAMLALVGLIGSLSVRRRRIWLRAIPGEPGRTVVEIGALARTEAGGLTDEVDRIVAELRPSGRDAQDDVHDRED